MSTPPRNAPCPCGSGRKFKFCCALNAASRGASPAPDAQAALARATRLHQDGETGEAEALCRTLLQSHPGHAEALHLLGLLRHEQGDVTEARSLLERAVAVSPDNGPLRNNLGELCRRSGEHEAAISHFQQALAIMGHTPELDRNIGLILLDLGQLDGAIDHLAASHQLHPDSAELLRLWGNALASAGREAEALARFRQGLALDPDHTGLLSDLAKLLAQQGEHDNALSTLAAAVQRQPGQVQLLHTTAQLARTAGRIDEACDALRRLLELDPGDSGAAHDLAALTRQTPDTTPPEHVRAIFDYYAPGFEHHLIERLHYDTPARLAALLRRHRSEPDNSRVLDLGCGTGLMGQNLQPHDGPLDGIDLSPRMLDIARQKGLYRQLIEGELVACMARLPAAGYDLITAADVLNYLGDLQPTFTEATRILSDGGLFLFSVELPDEEPECERFRLGQSGRFQHAARHVEHLAGVSGFERIAEEAIELRQESGHPVMGGLYLLRRRAQGV